MSEELIKVIKASLPSETNIVNLLADILFLGKDSIYRRLRGEVPFTFDELARIAERLNISLDSIVGIRHGDKSVFSIRGFYTNNDIFENCYITLEKKIELCQQLNLYSEQRISQACNTLPYALFFLHNNLSKFKIYRFLFQTHIIPTSHKLADVTIPDRLLKIRADYMAELKKVQTLELIFDENIFISTAKEILYFMKLGLITLPELMLLKEELFEALADTERYATIRDVYGKKQHISIYLSNIDIDASYLYYECKGFTVADIAVYSIGSLNTISPKICEVSKTWIDTYKRFSTSITHSSELYRHRFFHAQREELTKIFSSAQTKTNELFF